MGFTSIFIFKDLRTLNGAVKNVKKHFIFQLVIGVLAG